MRCYYVAAAVSGALLVGSARVPVCAHVVAGARVFPVTLNFDDPGVGDELSLPAFGYNRGAAGGGAGPTHEVDLGFEFDKTITPDTALIFNNGYDIQQVNGGKTQTGWENIVITGKWQAITNAPHEMVVSLGVQRELGGTGTDHLNGDQYGSTTPTLYFGKGLGDLPVQQLRPLAVTGELGYTIADREFKSFNVGNPVIGGGTSNLISTQTNSGTPNAWAGGLSVQYSIPYLQSQVRDIGLSGWAANVIPVVEFTWTSAASANSGQSTTWTAAPGFIYLARWGEIGLEATVPLNRASGSNVGAVGLVHFFFDDLFPHGLGAPVF